MIDLKLSHGEINDQTLNGLSNQEGTQVDAGKIIIIIL